MVFGEELPVERHTVDIIFAVLFDVALSYEATSKEDHLENLARGKNEISTEFFK